MPRETGTYRTSATQGETVKAFVPHPLPPATPPLAIEGDLAERHAAASGWTPLASGLSNLGDMAIGVTLEG